MSVSYQWVDIAFMEVDGVEMVSVGKLGLAVDHPGQAVKTMVKGRRPVGFMSGIPDFKATVEAKIMKGADRVDWLKWCLTKAQKLVTVQLAEGGARLQLRGCILDNYTPEFSQGGDGGMSLQLQFLDIQDDG